MRTKTGSQTKRAQSPAKERKSRGKAEIALKGSGGLPRTAKPPARDGGKGKAPARARTVDAEPVTTAVGVAEPSASEAREMKAMRLARIKEWASKAAQATGEAAEATHTVLEPVPTPAVRPARARKPRATPAKVSRAKAEATRPPASEAQAAASELSLAVIAPPQAAMELVAPVALVTSVAVVEPSPSVDFPSPAVAFPPTEVVESVPGETPPQARTVEPSEIEVRTSDIIESAPMSETLPSAVGAPEIAAADPGSIAPSRAAASPPPPRRQRGNTPVALLAGMLGNLLRWAGLRR